MAHRGGIRGCLLALELVLLVAAVAFAKADAAGTAPVAVPVGGRSSYVSPVRPMVVLHGFRPPASVYGAGHRGVDLAGRAGASVHAAAAGTVTFAGQVGGRGVVVVAHPDGIRTEYEPVHPSVTMGQTVSRGQLIGVLHGSHLRCRPTSCLHWGARRGLAYVDPLQLLEPLGPIRLLPWAGSAHTPRGPPEALRPTVRAGRGVLPRQARGWARSNVLRRRSTETWV